MHLFVQSKTLSTAPRLFRLTSEDVLGDTDGAVASSANHFVQFMVRFRFVFVCFRLAWFDFQRFV
jgi:hypothetical protein